MYDFHWSNAKYMNPSRATIPLIRPHQCDSDGGRIRGVLLYNQEGNHGIKPKTAPYEPGGQDIVATHPITSESSARVDGLSIGDVLHIVSAYKHQ